ncbi:hypothetical protein CYMTET_21987 [Cymbomonas tetramitiformis]|uniref:Uncharacterized protein n=1 Tax=Cymbomonas tetramitiformis TaxID=36881 RepID=A0AAE0F5R0_9CHLO|nr:hypothetical protein CYMTET_38409 [Cymbomonas tetramitiformis]KAK3269572.1 hypothetical protein CYMTET_21987 [Cymbomonas tetramitiformis]
MRAGFAGLTASTASQTIVRSHAAPGGPAPAGMRRLGITPNDTGESEDYDSDEADEKFDEELAIDGAAYVTGSVVAATPAEGGRACGVGQSAFASYVPKWLLVSTLLLCVTAVGALQASSGFQPGGVYSPAGFHTEWSMPLERTRERLVAGGASHYPNPPFDDSPPPPLDALADLLTVALEPDGILAAYQRGFIAALRLWDSPQVVPGAGGTAAGDALRTVVPPSGGEIYELTAENDVPEDEDGDATAYAGADLEHLHEI